MPDSVTNSDSAAARRTTGAPRGNAGGQPRGNAGGPQRGNAGGPQRGSAGGPQRGSAGGPPLKTKAEKRAEAKVAKARARARQQRRQILTVAGAAAIVLALVVGLVVWISTATGRDPAATTASPDAAAPSPTVAATDTAFPPLPAGADPALGQKPAVTAGTGAVAELTTTTLIKGTGAAAQAGQTINVNYVGVTHADGAEFDSSWSRSEPFTFQLGAGNVIQGWDRGLAGVTVGSRVQLDIPADLAYGDNPGGGRPAGALRFVVDLLSAS
ncbi:MULTISPECIES: FKBP-type peptidyl-prolyl cis-trans isomerase [Catenuloplanes]|uniref:Peptidyl-prolyl cis-trans isomerase n=1 Tax=Catenuloplanes niger TaxID=587534 RepID=A0AAE4CZN7_9ACTN|nr:FKBP-type peptidyl-prolyl cis-trans isomerase [Catenuloplanes niger]MDR7327089.1 peptidylprolyl isomerase [Catenuloplanes niger]